MTEQRNNSINDWGFAAPALTQAYRARLAAQRTLPQSEDAELLADLANHVAQGEQRDEALGRITDSDCNADLLRTLQALEADAEALSAGVARLRTSVPARRRPAVVHLRWLASAASVGLAAVLFVVLRAPVAPDQAGNNMDWQAAGISNEASSAPVQVATIMSGSFEQGGSEASRPSIFTGDFDS